MGVQAKVKDLRPGMEGVTIVFRVLEDLGTRSVLTRNGRRRLSEYIVGDDTGKVHLVVWNPALHHLELGRVFVARGAWVSEYRGRVQLNIGSRTRIEGADDGVVPKAEEIPDSYPQPQSTRGRRGRGRRWK